jgi:serine phosphatase RsbU (regulator of sigma subunit)
MKYFKKIFYSLLLICIYSNSIGQITRLTIKIDQIKNRIESTNSDSTKIILYSDWNNLSYIFDETHKQELKINQTIVGLCNQNILNETNIEKKNWFKEKLWISLNNIGHYYNDIEDLDNALNYFVQCSKVLKEINNPNSLSITYTIIGNIFQELNNDKKALNYFQKSLQIEENLRQNSEMQMIKAHVTDSIERVKAEAIYEMELAGEKKKLDAEKDFRNVLIGGIFLFIVSFILVFFQWRKTKNQNKIIIEQHKLLDETHKEITDSINYAKNIQDALMTSVVYLNDVLPDSFIFLKPKDVVSGDYYWVHKTNEDEVFFTVADCTGHGVPGAFMSMIGNSLLNENIIENKIKTPATILDNMRENIINSLNQKDPEKANKDGMDMALCKFNKKSMTVEFAGANNPLVHVRNGEINHIKANYQPVAISAGAKKPFTNHEIKVEKGDMLFIYSDGFADQFGGPKGKKYMSRKFRVYLASISSFSSKEQSEKLEKEFYRWKGDQDQIDDVCVMGVKI